MINPDAADSLAILITNLDAGRLAALRDVMVSIEGIPPAHVDIFDGLFSDAGFDARALCIIAKGDGKEAVDEVNTMALAGVSAMVAGATSVAAVVEPQPLAPMGRPYDWPNKSPDVVIQPDAGMASAWLQGEMADTIETIAEAKDRLWDEYNDLLNKSGGGFAKPEESARLRILSANVADFRKEV